MKRFWSGMRCIQKNLLLLAVAALLSGGLVMPVEGYAAAASSPASSSAQTQTASIRTLRPARVIAAIASNEQKSSETVVKDAGRIFVVKRSALASFVAILSAPVFFCLSGLSKAHLPRLALPANRAVIIQYIHEQDGLK